MLLIFIPNYFVRLWLQGVAIKKPDSCSNPLLKKNQTIEMLSPSMYTPPQFLHRSLRIFHCWKQCCRSSCVMLFKSCVAFAFTASTDSNLVPLSADLVFGKRKMLHGARSGKYGGCSITGMLFFAKYLFTDSALCAGALSWWRIHEAFFHMSGLLCRTHSRRFVKTFL